MTHPAESDRPGGDGARVCPSCGRLPGAGIHCEHCGTNLLWRLRLPTRYQWRAGKAREGSDFPSGRERLRYLPRELKAMYVGPDERAKQGWLMLTLVLNEKLEADECVTAVFNSNLFGIESWWLVVTSERLLCLQAGPVIIYRRRKASIPLSKITGLRSVPLPTGNNIFIRTGPGILSIAAFPMARATAARLIEALREAKRS